MPRNKPANPGWFAKGADPRRHKLTAWERSLGYLRAMERAAGEGASRYAWLYRKVRSYYRQQRREGTGRRPGRGLASLRGEVAC